MSPRIAHWPAALRERTRLLTLGPAPALLAHPDGRAPAPLLLWLHGRTAAKETESARLLRLIRARIAVCAIDLPGHGERLDPALHALDALPRLLARARPEIDEVLGDLEASPWADLVRLDRLACGGMSAGGMVVLRRLCDEHPFRCAVVESTAGDLESAARGPGGSSHWLAARRDGLDPVQHLAGWRPLPLLALHSEKDQIAPVAGIRSFVEALREEYRRRGADPESVRLVTWPETGAPGEHASLGRQAGKGRRLVCDFLREHLEP